MAAPSMAFGLVARRGAGLAGTAGACTTPGAIGRTALLNVRDAAVLAGPLSGGAGTALPQIAGAIPCQGAARS